jgi:hypothetical protein
MNVGTAELPVRVALIGCGGLLGDVIRTSLSAEPNLTVVASMQSPPPGADLTSFDADIVLWNAADERRIDQWLSAYPAVPRVLAITSDGQDAALWELTPHRVGLGALSPQSLVETIRRTRTGRR